MVWARKQLLVYCGTGLKGTVTPAAAIKAKRSAHTSDKLFAAPAAHKDVCLFAIVCEGLTKSVPAEVAAVFPPFIFHPGPAASISFADMKPCRDSRFVHSLFQRTIAHEINLAC